MTDPTRNDKWTIGWAIALVIITVVLFGSAVAMIQNVKDVEPTYQVAWESGEAKLNRETMPVDFWHDEQRNLLIHRGEINQGQRAKLLELGSGMEDAAKTTYRQSIEELTFLSNVPQAPLWFLMIITAIGGIIGVQARSISYFILHACVKNDLDLKRWWAWYGLRPLLGMIFGPLVVLLNMTGVQPTPGVPQANTLTMFVLSILVGMVASMFFDKLVQTAQTLFGLNPDDAPPQPPSDKAPKPVTASGKWDPAANEAVITWTASDEKLDHYEVRMTPGATYDPEKHFVTILQPGTLTHRTAEGLANAGDTASFKVYVVLDNANESGSETVLVKRE